LYRYVFRFTPRETVDCINPTFDKVESPSTPPFLSLTHSLYGQDPTSTPFPEDCHFVNRLVLTHHDAVLLLALGMLKSLSYDDKSILEAVNIT
jgi:hypothetical protein